MTSLDFVSLHIKPAVNRSCGFSPNSRLSSRPESVVPSSAQLIRRVRSAGRTAGVDFSSCYSSLSSHVSLLVGL